MTMEPWHAGFLESLEAAADLHGQRTAWVDRTNTQFPDPVELMCQLFDDSGVFDLLADGGVFCEATDAALRRLSVLADGLDVEADPGLLLSSAGWLEFAGAAARALELVSADLAE